MSESNTLIPPGSEIPFFDQLEATSDSTGAVGSPLESRHTLIQPNSGNYKVHFGFRKALDLNNRYTLDLRSRNESPDLDQIPQQPPLATTRVPPITFTPPNAPQPRKIYPQREYLPSPIDIDSLDVPIQEKVFVPEIPPGVYDQSHGSEQPPAEKKAARLSQIGCVSIPSSAQTSPVLNPINPLNSCTVSAGHSQGGEIVDVLDLKEDIEIKYTFKKPEARSKIIVTKEASDLVRHHTQRGIRPPQSLAGAGDAIKPGSGASKPIACRNEDYAQSPDHFRGGVLGNLLKLYNPPHYEGSRNHPHHGYSNSVASTVVGSPTASGRTTPKWYNKSANTSTTSLGGLLAASGSTPVTNGKNTRPKIKHRPHCNGVVGAIKTFSGKSLEEEIKV